MFRYVSLVGHYADSVRFARLSSSATRRRQLVRFRRLFEHAREHSPFYRRLYREAGVDRLVIRDWADIERVPVVDKPLLRTVPTQDLMTRPITPDLVRITTSGSTREPFVIYQARIEQYTSHVRVFAMLWELGWRPWQRILMLTRREPDAVLSVEQNLGVLTRLRRGLGLFERESHRSTPLSRTFYAGSTHMRTHLYSGPRRVSSRYCATFSRSRAGATSSGWWC